MALSLSLMGWVFPSQICTMLKYLHPIIPLALWEHARHGRTHGCTCNKVAISKIEMESKPKIIIHLKAPKCIA